MLLAALYFCQDIFVRNAKCVCKKMVTEKKNCKIDPKEKNSERYIVCDSKEERFSPFNPLLDKKVWPVEAQNVRFSMRVCVCPNSRFSLPRLRSTYSGEPFSVHIYSDKTKMFQQVR